MIDWPTARDSFRSLIADGTLTVAPRRLVHDRWNVRGGNLATPDYLGHVLDSDRNPVEITTGTMPCFGERPRREQRIYGLTWPRVAGRPDDRDRMVLDLDEIAAALGVSS